ncbi:MAG TPA: isopentenyl transferase family protein [Streptosporangiaceae bacterium]|nr:isopentenyl transferase family protein [Streptosporangiaceae bacterium]
MKVHAVLGATGTGKTRLATKVAHSLDVPVVVADRLQCFTDIPIVSSRPAFDPRRRYLDRRTIPEGDLPPRRAYDLLLTTLRRLGDRHRTVVLEGGSISLLTRLFGDLGGVGFELHADVLPIGPDYAARTRARVDEALERGLLVEFDRAWAHAEQRDFVASIAGFDVLARWCRRRGVPPGRLAGVRDPARTEIADELVRQALLYADRQDDILAAAGVKPLGEGRDQCCQAVTATLRRLSRVYQNH